MYRKKYYEANKEKLLAYSKKYRQANKEACAEREKKYYKTNKEKVLASNKKYSEANKEDIQKYKKNYQKIKYNSEPIFRIQLLLRHRLWTAFQLYSKNGKIRTSDEYGINYNAICEWLGPQPDDREDYHIDHIKPLCTFDFNDAEQIKEAFAPENHQWLLAEKNLRKGGRYPNNKYKIDITKELDEFVQDNRELLIELSK